MGVVSRKGSYSSLNVCIEPTFDPPSNPPSPSLLPEFPDPRPKPNPNLSRHQRLNQLRPPLRRDHDSKLRIHRQRHHNTRIHDVQIAHA